MLLLGTPHGIFGLDWTSLKYQRVTLNRASLMTLVDIVRVHMSAAASWCRAEVKKSYWRVVHAERDQVFLSDLIIHAGVVLRRLRAAGLFNLHLLNVGRSVQPASVSGIHNRPGSPRITPEVHAARDIRAVWPHSNTESGAGRGELLKNLGTRARNSEDLCCNATGRKVLYPLRRFDPFRLETTRMCRDVLKRKEAEDLVLPNGSPQAPGIVPEQGGVALRSRTVRSSPPLKSIQARTVQLEEETAVKLVRTILRDHFN